MRVFLTGATGFVGLHLYPALQAAGFEVRCGSRRPRQAADVYSEREWVSFDVEEPETLEPALRGCDTAFYLVHNMGQGQEDYPAREAASAKNFAEAARRAGVRRIVYLGGVFPRRGDASRHLISRKRTGEILRSVHPSCVEIRAAMIVGAGSASFRMLKGLTRHVPAIFVPPWMKAHSYPVAIDDVVWALLAALWHPTTGGAVFDVPGPERMDYPATLQRLAAVMGLRRRIIWSPLLSRRSASHWIERITRIDPQLVRELIEGANEDLEPRDEVLWREVERRPLSFEEACHLALSRDADAQETRMRAIGTQIRETSPWAHAARHVRE